MAMITDPNDPGPTISSHTMAELFAPVDVPRETSARDVIRELLESHEAAVQAPSDVAALTRARTARIRAIELVEWGRQMERAAANAGNVRIDWDKWALARKRLP